MKKNDKSAYSINNLYSLGSSEKLESGRTVGKPENLTNNQISKIELLRKSNSMGSSKEKKAVSQLGDLPEEIKKSIEKKAKLHEILNNGRHYTVEDLKIKLAMEKKPIDKKRASQIKEERIMFFKENIEKLKLNKKRKIKIVYEE
ncbi:hypothetical protein [Spiroplasma cantharicola]|uniref:Uncharacterized protein n=1 Tax=Spiroplasma cantharicola TaxID=362837 RepID=A0A0M3SJA2_9MOLU|nr:hypothetical protein [Spiroplasma cantharicola]ALD66398.1 hypothetical protein SCANT_v1c04920 [Spiroplasma cantharicola]